MKMTEEINKVRDEIFNEGYDKGYDAGYDKAYHEKEIEIDNAALELRILLQHVYYALDDVDVELKKIC